MTNLPSDVPSDDNQRLKALFELADKVGNKRYNRLTRQDFDDYRKFDYWRYVNGDSECGTTQESKDWVKENSDWHCPICGDRFSRENGRTIDHKLPRAQYPWLSLDFRNLWVICRPCNYEKGEMHWYEYERYTLNRYPDRYPDVRARRPSKLLESLRD
ncbi:HNH endonuclease [Leptolyngbya sp. AN02str]|uniref:HNH endonuclease n=1 Tax=Leptolyngbya sp. AN02str TaxID=3423363 RepID=UPI003D321960